MNHPTLIQWQIQILTLFPAVALNLDRSHRIQAVPTFGTDRSRDAMLNMALPIAHRPCLAFFPVERSTRTGWRSVDAAGDVGVAAGAEDGGGAGVGVDAGEVGRELGGSSDLCRGWRRCRGGRRRIRFRRSFRSSPPKIRAQNLKRESTSGKKGGRFVPRRRFSKSKRPPTRPLVDTDLKKAGGGLIGVDARGRKQADDAVRFDQIHGTFDEERVEVDVGLRPAADIGTGLP